MSDDLPNPGRRALVVWYDDDTNTVEVDASAFTWLELPELLRAAMDYAELGLPTHSGEYADDTED